MDQLAQSPSRQLQLQLHLIAHCVQASLQGMAIVTATQLSLRHSRSSCHSKLTYFKKRRVRRHKDVIADLVSTEGEIGLAASPFSSPSSTPLSFQAYEKDM